MKTFRTLYGIKTKIQQVNSQPSKAKQQFKEECDINNILKKYQTKGILPEMIQREPRYGDFSEVPEYQNALNIVIHANEQFQALPAKIRDRFQNNPELFLDFVHNKENLNEMVQMGIAKLPEIPVPPQGAQESSPGSNLKNPTKE